MNEEKACSKHSVCRAGEADFELALVRCLPAWLKPLCRQLSLERMEKASRADD